MARSEEALQRRALKRQRTLDEQRRVERQAMEKAKEKSMLEKKKANDSAIGEDPMKEGGAWTCPKCGNENFASRNWCNSKTCDQARPYHIEAPPPFRKAYTKHASRENHHQSSRHTRQRENNSNLRNPMNEPGAWKCESCGRDNFASRDVCFTKECQRTRPKESAEQFAHKKKKDSRHNEATSKKLLWAKQADSSTVSKNQELRRRYQETGGEGMQPDEVERAKILIARDERKRQKKEENSRKKTKNEIVEKTKDASPSFSETKESSLNTKSFKSNRDQNMALRERYLETFGEGMKPEQIARAKILIARDERKRKRKFESSQERQSRAQ